MCDNKRVEDAALHDEQLNRDGAALAIGRCHVVVQTIVVCQ